MKRFFNKFFNILNLSTLFICFLYVLLGITIAIMASLFRPKNKAITLLTSIQYMDLFYSARFLLLISAIIAGSLFIITLLSERETTFLKFRDKIKLFTYFIWNIWLVISFSLLLLNSFKTDVYNLITVIIATAISIWKPVKKISESLTNLTYSLVHYRQNRRGKKNQVRMTTRSSRRAPKYPPRRFSRHTRH